MNREIMLGDEAVARAAIDAGISGAYSYPGTPSTEIFETVEALTRREDLSVHTRWSTNEKVAYEEALGLSYAGCRALVSFKHVGLNVAADPFMNSAISGIHGGLVVVVADDPSMHSSQNEQDSRYYADFARVLCFEPSDPQQAYDMTREAFEISERLRLPVMLRLVTRLAHSRSIVQPASRQAPNIPGYCPDFSYWTLLPSNARRGFDLLLQKQPQLQEISRHHTSNELVVRGKGRPGVLATGIAWDYVVEALQEKVEKYNTLRLGVYPLPLEKARRLVDASSELWIFEEGYPFVERYVSALGLNPSIAIKGKQGGPVPASGELSPDTVRAAFGLVPAQGMELREAEEILKPRPPLLCDGCPHTDAYKAMKQALTDYPDARIFGDIGCYTLGFYKPHEAIHACLCMGASISMAVGASHAGMRPVLAVIGDSTFTHSGLTPLLDAARENCDLTVLILDNSIVAMTGGQANMASDRQLAELVTGLGVPPEHLRVIRPLARHHDENARIIHEEIEYRGLSVIIASRECVTYYKQIREMRRN
jgi:indolepyruvate ferredoxin oxidoreductase, alpha subunit